MSMLVRKQQKIDGIKNLLDSKEISQDQHDRAVNLTNNHNPWYWKKNEQGKITGIVDIFANMEAEKKNKRKRKS